MDDNNKPQDQQIPEEQPQPKEEGGEDKEKEALDNSKNPERTKDYIDKLKEDRDKYKKLFENKDEQPQNYQQPISQAPSAQSYSHLNQQQVNQAFQSMVDQDGYLDGAKFSQYLEQQNQRAIQAEKRAERAEQGIQQINKTLNDQKEKEAQKKVYEKYPMLNPEGENFDSTMWNYVYNELGMKARQGINPSDSDYLEAADKVYNDFYKERDMNKKDQEQLDNKNNQKIQTNAMRPRSSMSHGYFDGVEEDNLREQVRAGKKGALAELLRRKEQSQSQ